MSSLRKVNSHLSKRCAFIDPTYAQDGDQVDSQFMREVGLLDYEPMCIEAIHSKTEKPLQELLKGASYSDQWLPNFTLSCEADAAICVFEPNVVESPSTTSLQYCGAFFYQP